MTLPPRPRSYSRPGDFVVRRPSGGTGFLSLEDVAPLLAPGGVRSDPPPDGLPVLGLYVRDEKLVVEYDDEP